MDWVLLGLFLFQTVYSGHLKTFKTVICLRGTRSNKTYLGLHSMKQQSIVTLSWMERSSILQLCAWLPSL